MKITQFLTQMVEKNASDLLLRAGGIPRLRIDGKIWPVDHPVLTSEDMRQIAKELLTDETKRKQFEDNLDVDFVLSESGVGRFRINIFVQRGSPSLVARHVKDIVRTFEELNLPAELLKKMSLENRGLFLVTGPAGCGKSTTIATMIDYMNTNAERHIITVEDPIEFLFKDKKSMINQRELGLDVYTYPSALKHFTLQSPDVIFIGLIRDPETMAAAISAAEMGVLVISTLHTTNAVQTTERIVNFFPPYLHNEVRLQLSLLLKGVLCLRLIPRKDAPGRIPAYESMVLTPTITRVLREGKIWEITRYLEEGQLFGMQSFKQSLVKLVKEEKISEDEARKYADSRDELELELRGIRRLSR